MADSEGGMGGGGEKMEIQKSEYLENEKSFR